jgi:hypothetical protein
MITIASLKAALTAAGVQDSDTIVYVSLKSPVEPPQVTRRVLSDGTFVVEVVN